MQMQLRSGRRPASPVPAPGGDSRRVRPRCSQDDGNNDDGEDWISNLPENMRVEVLARLPSTREAMRTSVLSEQWRGLWTQLRELTFERVTDLDWLLSALAQVRPNLNRLCIDLPPGNLAQMTLGSQMISTLLDAADRLAPLELVVGLFREHSSGPFVLPCFRRTTSIKLFIFPLRFTLPPTGSFESLEEMVFFGASFIDPGVLLPRCPRLRKLQMDGNCPRRVKTLAVESSSLEELLWDLFDIDEPVDVRVVTPNLRKFEFSSHSRKFTMSLSAPKLEELDIQYYPEDCSVGYAEKWSLWCLKWSSRHGQHVLSLTIDNEIFIPFLEAEQNFPQEVARLPVTNFSVLELHIQSEGHVFGALVSELLQIRTTIKKLKIVLLGSLVVECWESCDCDIANNWRNERIFLPNLEVAEFEGFCGHDHEIDFLKLLVGSAPRLKTMDVQHFNVISKVREACQKLHNIFSANAFVKFTFS